MPRHAGAISAAELKTAVAAGEKLTVIDIRNPAQYAKGHIPGAFNIPASLVPVKRLPKLGRVVVCGEGLGRDNPTAAATELNRKPGIQAETLDGGYQAWWAERGQTTETPGFKPSVLDYVTYQQLKDVSEEVIIADLRGLAPLSRQSQSEPPSPLTNLAEEFPGATIVDSPFEALAKTRQGAHNALPPLLALIDRGDGEAEKMARALRANRKGRVVILMGGEEILRRKGQAGLLRLGPGNGRPASPLGEP